MLDANETQLDFPTLFASGRDGWAVADPATTGGDLAPLFELILAHVPPPRADPKAPFAMLATTLDYDPYLGRVLTGLIQAGVVRVNMPVKSLGRDGSVLEQARLTKLLAYRGLERRPIEEARAFHHLRAELGLAQEEIAGRVGKDLLLAKFLAFAGPGQRALMDHNDPVAHADQFSHVG